MPSLTLPITIYYANNLARQAPPAYQAGQPMITNPYAKELPNSKGSLTYQQISLVNG